MFPNLTKSKEAAITAALDLNKEAALGAITAIKGSNGTLAAVLLPVKPA